MPTVGKSSTFNRKTVSATISHHQRSADKSNGWGEKQISGIRWGNMFSGVAGSAIFCTFGSRFLARAPLRRRRASLSVRPVYVASNLRARPERISDQVPSCSVGLAYTIFL
eukprot:133388_1